MRAPARSASNPYRANSQVILKAYEGYWQGWKDNQFTRVAIQHTPESATHRQMLESGEADFASDLPVEDVEALKDNPKLIFQQTKSFENMLIAMNCVKEGSVKDKRVR